VPLSAAQEAWLEAKTQAGLYRKARANLDGQLAISSKQRHALDGERPARRRGGRAGEAAARDLEAGRATLDEARTRHGEAERDLAARRERLARREKALNDQASEVERGRLDAEAGFLEQEREHLRQAARAAHSYVG
jgi:hypothetical protein